jgi:hypothetical protein
LLVEQLLEIIFTFFTLNVDPEAPAEAPAPLEAAELPAPLLGLDPAADPLSPMMRS